MVPAGTATEDGLMQTTLETSTDLLAEHRVPWVTGPVVVGFDGSDSALRGLELIAGAMADSARLIVAVVEPQVHSRGLLGEPLLQPRLTPGELLDSVRKRLETHDRRLRLQTRHVKGDPAAVLVDIASHERAVLLVVGGCGHDFEARVLLGSVAERVVRLAHCTVLVVR
jgi:nucleotide-binding universal stress UspA family protein